MRNRAKNRVIRSGRVGTRESEKDRASRMEEEWDACVRGEIKTVRAISYPRLVILPDECRGNTAQNKISVECRACDSVPRATV